MEELAREMRMSPSGMHSCFRAVTSLSPLQYQKQLRLQEARRILFSDALDAATVSRQVGYESPSQFNREYRRFFGSPPTWDNIKGALIGVAATRFKDFVGEIVPGFHEQLRKTETEVGATERAQTL